MYQTGFLSHIQIYKGVPKATPPEEPGEITPEDLPQDLWTGNYVVSLVVAPLVLFTDSGISIIGNTIQKEIVSEGDVLFSDSALEIVGHSAILHFSIPDILFASTAAPTEVIQITPPDILYIANLTISEAIQPEASLVFFDSDPEINGDMAVLKINPPVFLFHGRPPYIRRSDGVIWTTGEIVGPVDNAILFETQDIHVGLPIEFLHHSPPSILFDSLTYAIGLNEYIIPDLPFYTVYRCTLTGLTDDLDDLTLKISSFTARLRSGTPTYCSVIVPNAVLNADAINERSNGQLVIDEGRFFSDGSSHYFEIVRVNLESIAYDTGIRNSSMSLSGHITQTNSSTKSINLNNSVSQESLQADGLIRLKTAVNFLVKPGDTIIWNNSSKSMVAGLITIVVGKTAYMDITEASA
jgi:hypothetical protein